jgi:hypothetical protein
LFYSEKRLRKAVRACCQIEDKTAIHFWVEGEVEVVQRPVRVAERSLFAAPFQQTSQLPVAKWHGQIGDPTVADSILDRLVHAAHRLEMQGESMRKRRRAGMEKIANRGRVAARGSQPTASACCESNCQLNHEPKAVPLLF